MSIVWRLFEGLFERTALPLSCSWMVFRWINIHSPNVASGCGGSVVVSFTDGCFSGQLKICVNLTHN